MKFISPSSAWLTLIVALAAWGAVVSFAFSIDAMTQDAVVRQENAQSASDQTTVLLRMRTLSREIAPERVQLEGLLQNDPLSLAASIIKAGKDAGVALHVSDATPEGPPVSLAGGAGAQTTAIGFSIEASGTFEALAHAVSLLESLPEPAVLQQLQFDHAPTGGQGAWDMRAQLRILTGSPISS